MLERCKEQSSSREDELFALELIHQSRAFLSRSTFQRSLCMVLVKSSRVRPRLINSGKITGLSVILKLSSATGNLGKIAFSDKPSIVLLRRFYVNKLN